MHAHQRTVHSTSAEGLVLDWLVSPAWSSPCDDLERFVASQGEPWGDEGRWVLTNGPDVSAFKERILPERMNTSQPLPDVVEGGPMAWEAGGTSYTGLWQRRRTAWDGFVDWSDFFRTPHYRCALAATSLEVDQAEWRTLEFACTGPFVLWLDGEEVARSTRVSYMEPEVQRVRVRLHSGITTVHVATWQVALRECRQIFSLRVDGLPVRVVIPSPGADETVSRWGEGVLEQVALRSWAVDGDTVDLHTVPELRLRVRVDDGEWMPVRADVEGCVSVPLRDKHDNWMLSTGESQIEARLDDDRCPVSRVLRCARLPQGMNTNPSTDSSNDVRAEIIDTVATRPGLGGALARARTNPDVPLDPADFEDSLQLVERRGDCADFEVISLLTAWQRIPDRTWPENLRQRVRETITGCKYWITQPGLDAMCYFTENHQFVWHVAQHLAGSTFPDEQFTVDDRVGAEHADEGARRAAAWMRRKLTGGFSEFDSNAYLAIDTYALAVLIELSTDEPLTRIARTLLDTLLVTLASNSWRGVHGAAHGRSYVRTLRSGRFEETSPILRLIAGMGTINDSLLPVSALALSTQYRVPPVVRAIATDLPEHWWGRQVYEGQLAFERDLLQRPYRSDLRLWRTPHVMLSSVTDYRAGLPGLQEHVWGATLGSECQVFITHPANADWGGSARPNSWAGHRILPRVHQHREALVGLQRFTPSDPVQRTHLWWPKAQFDEIMQLGDWLIGQRGEGYVAVATPGGFSPVQRGDTAEQEWRPRGDGARWVACVGDTSDGAFSAWAEQVARSAVEWAPLGAETLAVRWTTPSGRVLEVSFDGAFLVDGKPEDYVDGHYAAPNHIENPALTWPFEAERVRVAWGGEELDIDVAGAVAAAEEVERRGR